MINIQRIKELCSHLDCEIYWKDCNFVNEDDGKLTFYSRDLCYNISFEELIKWYIERVNHVQMDDENDEKEYTLRVNDNIENLMELIKIFSIYNALEKLGNL